MKNARGLRRVTYTEPFYLHVTFEIQTS